MSAGKSRRGVERFVFGSISCADTDLVINLRANIMSMQSSISQDHPNIVRLEEVYESHSEIYLVQEVCRGGELFDRLDEQPDYRYTEAQVCTVCYYKKAKFKWDVFLHLSLTPLPLPPAAS